MTKLSNKLIISFTVACAAVSVALADELETPNEMDTTLEATSISERDQPEQDSARDPFWPVGYSPAGDASDSNDIDDPVERTVRDEEDMNRLWNQAQAQVTVSGFSRMGGDGYMAVINDRIMREGETIRVTHENMVFRWRVDEISNAGVKLTRAGVENPDNGGT